MSRDDSGLIDDGSPRRPAPAVPPPDPAAPAPYTLPGVAEFTRQVRQIEEEYGTPDFIASRLGPSYGNMVKEMSAAAALQETAIRWGCSPAEVERILRRRFGG